MKISNILLTFLLGFLDSASISNSQETQIVKFNSNKSKKKLLKKFVMKIL